MPPAEDGREWWKLQVGGGERGLGSKIPERVLTECLQLSLQILLGCARRGGRA
jgi:hypothetical protein